MVDAVLDTEQTYILEMFYYIHVVSAQPFMGTTAVMLF